MQKNILLILVVVLVIGLGFSFLSFYSQKPASVTQSTPEKSCDFEIKEVYFEESQYPDSPFLKIKGVVGSLGFYKYIIYFPPQEKTKQGIGPIEVGGDTPCTEQSCRPLNPCQEFTTQDMVYRSYPDNVPVHGTKYFAKITFYLNDKTEKIWEGEVDWKS